MYIIQLRGIRFSAVLLLKIILNRLDLQTRFIRTFAMVKKDNRGKVTI